MNIPCNIKITCPCLNSNPLAGFSAEPPDQLFRVGRGFTGVIPNLGYNWGVQACQTLAMTTSDQASADLLATSEGVNCVVSTFTNPQGNSVGTYSNMQQSGTAMCPDGLLFTYIVPAGTFTSASSQLDANTQALTYAQNQALSHRICLSNLAASQTCAGSGYSQPITASGAFLAVAPQTDTWSVSYGSLPPGLSLSATSIAGGVVNIMGTATTAGVFNFNITVTDPLGDSMTKPYTITISGITNANSLPQPIKNAFYSQTLTTAGISTPIFSLLSGLLPVGLSLSSGGVISGTATGNGTSTFTVKVVDGVTGLACSTPISMTVNGTCAYPVQQLGAPPAQADNTFLKVAVTGSGSVAAFSVTNANVGDHRGKVNTSNLIGAPFGAIQNIDVSVASVSACYCPVANGGHATVFCWFQGQNGVAIIDSSTLATITNTNYPGENISNALDIQFNSAQNLVYANMGSALLVIDPTQGGGGLIKYNSNPSFVALFGKVNFDSTGQVMYCGGYNPIGGGHNQASVFQWNISNPAAPTATAYALPYLPNANNSTVGGTAVYCPDNQCLYVSYQKVGVVNGYFIGVFKISGGSMTQLAELTVSDTFSSNATFSGTSVNYSENGCYSPASKLVYICFDNSVQIVCTTNNALLTPLAGVKSLDAVYVATNQSVYLLDYSSGLSTLKAYS